jgi:hypothetical protein
VTPPVPSPARRRTWLAHAVVVLVGLLVLAYPFTVGAVPHVTCRGATMQPGDSCAKADSSGTQTYEQRARDQRNARPVIAVGGAVVTAFGAVLLVGELRRRSRPVR